MLRTSITLAAAMAVAGLTLTPPLMGQAQPGSPGPTQLRDTAQQTADVTAIRTLVANSSDAALRPNSFGDVIGDFATPPVSPGSIPARPAVPGGGANPGPSTAAPGTVSPVQSAAPGANAGATAVTREQTHKLNDQIRAFHQAFKNRFGFDFVIKDPQTLFGDITAANLEEAQAQAAAAEIKAQTGQAPPPAPATPPPPPANPDLPPTNSPTNNPNNVMQSPEWSTLTLPEYRGAPAVTVHLIRVGNSFRYAIARQVNEQELVTNLTAAVTQVNDNQAHWPEDPNTTTRMVSQFILGAIQRTQQAEAATNPVSPKESSGQGNEMR